MWNGVDTLYGNEWINYEQTYYKIKVADNGVYKISYTSLLNAGIPVGVITASQFQVYHLGKEIPIYISSKTILSSEDYIEFYGQKNRSELDRFLFKDPDNEMLNPEYSLFNDTSAYFLTWAAPDMLTLRYEEVENDLTNLPEKEGWFWAEEAVVFSEEFLKNYTRISGTTLYYSNFEVAEGYGNRGIDDLLAEGNTSHIVDIALPGLVSTGPNSKVSVRFATGLGSHHQVFRVNGTQFFAEEFSNVKVKDWTALIPSNTGNDIKVELEGLVNERDEAALSVVKVEYPHSFDLENQNIVHFKLDASSIPQYLEVQNFDLANGTPVIYDLTNQTRIEGAVESGVIRISLPASARERQLVLVNNQTSARQINTLGSTSFTNYFEEEGDFIIISHPLLYGQGNETNWVAEYAQYRSSEIGGNFRTITIDIQQLYDQFAYGVDRHSISIRNFAHFANKHWPDPKYILLIGKGREYTNLRSAEGLAANLGQSFFLPSFGFPASDNLLLSNNESSVPIIPVGRIAATTPNEIRIYLDKVKGFDDNRNQPQTIEGKLWMKRLLHLGGGGNSGEQNAIRNNLINMEREIANSTFGGEVMGIYKTSTDLIQETQTDAIFDRINSGVSIITFFGHSSPGTFDFNIDNPRNYNNAGKYPLMLSLGCYSGNIFTSSKGISERFCFLENKAAIAFGASRGVGFISTLSSFGKEFYEVIGEEIYGSGIGDGIKAAVATFDSNQSLSMKTLVQQFTLHGDPAIRLHPSNGPDYTIDASSVKFTPRVISIQQDSFNIQFDVVNLGFAKQDSLGLEIFQETPKGVRRLLIKKKIPTPSFSTTLNFRLASLGKESVGLNTFFINLDKDNNIEEVPVPFAEQNNELVRSSGELGIPFFVLDNAATPVFPPNFGIVNDLKVVLKASTTDPLAPERKYFLQLDTTERFSSPWRKETTITQKGGVVKWEPMANFTENTVYYWRISPESSEEGVDTVWEQRSFVYLPNQGDGWNQSHFYQYKKNNFTNLELNQSGFEFDVNGFFITIKNKIANPGERPSFIFNLETPAASVRPWSYVNNGVAVFVGDAVTGLGWINPPGGEYGSVNPSSNTRVFTYPTNTISERETLIRFLEDIIPTKSYVYIFTILNDNTQSFRPEEWEQDSLSLGTNLFEVLEEQGAQFARQLKERGSVPYTFIYQKDKGVLGEDIASNIEEAIRTEVFIPVKQTMGNLKSTIIGPVRSWERLSWQFSEIDNIESDQAYIKIFGINSNQSDTILLVESVISKDTTLDFVDANQFPYLLLEMHTQDEALRTSVDLDYWRVFYEGLPDAAINPNLYFEAQQDTLQQGALFSLETAVENVSNYDMDSLLVKFIFTDALNNQRTVLEKYRPLAKQDSLNLVFKQPTVDVEDIQNLVIEINPEQDQPERFRFNNLLRKEFFIQKDKLNPLLDVTFDGVHILSGDLVSSNPQINITLTDENQYLLLTDTSLFDISIKFPNESQVRNLSFGAENVEFIPANSTSQNQAQVIYQPELLVDGLYHLTIQAKDRTGNRSGGLDYSVSFNVINKKMISNVLNYPNPFSTSTQFVYTLTGNGSPAQYKIQIMTSSGRIVREISEIELGPLKVGTHRTDYAWDGTDEFGDKLANGVYFYRFIIKTEGEKYEHFDNGTDRFFKNDIGKLVILR